MRSVPGASLPATSLADVAPTALVGGVFGTHSAALYFCGLCPGIRKPYFRSADEKAHHLEMVHRAYVWLRDEAEGGGYGYEAGMANP